jgi:hypothetical protein
MMRVKDIVGDICITEEDGSKLYEAIHPQLEKKQKVELDMSGVIVFASPFFNAAIGNLLADIPADILNEKLILHNLEPTDRTLLKKVIDNANRIFADPNYRENIKRVVLDELGDGGHAIRL